MHHLRVGEPYSVTRTRWPQGSDYNFRCGHHELRLFLPDLSNEEIEAVRAGRAEFRLFTREGLLVLLYRFGDMPWSDASYNWHLVSEEERIPPEAPVDESQGAALTVLLIEANTGILKVIRLIGLGHEFTLALHAEIRKQIAEAFDREEYLRRVELVYRMYSSDQMAQVARIKFAVDREG